MYAIASVSMENSNIAHNAKNKRKYGRKREWGKRK